MFSFCFFFYFLETESLALLAERKEIRVIFRIAILVPEQFCSKSTVP